MDSPTEGMTPPFEFETDDPSPSERERSRFGPGIYIHFPFCVQRCGYCDFFVVLAGDDAREAFVESLLQEIDLAADRRAPHREVGVVGSSPTPSGSAGAPGLGAVGGAGPEDARRSEPRTGELLGTHLPHFEGEVFRSIFFGGGTPSLLAPAQLEAILTRLRRRFPFHPEAEITVECNPESATRDRLHGYRVAGVDRISFGVQSMDREELRLLDRAHGAADVTRRMDDARRVGIPAVSLDLIYGLPGTGASHRRSGNDPSVRDEEMRWLRTLESALALGPDHLSSYLLTLEPHVPLARRLRRGQVSALPEDEDTADQYNILRARTAANGLAQYEISNFARPGQESLHNQNYWLAGDYLGLGPSAHSHRSGVRWSNVRSLGGYREAVADGRRPVEMVETLTRQQRAEEWIFLGLRRLEGVPVSVLTEWWGEGAWDRIRSAGSLSNWLEFDEPLAAGENRVRLAPDGLFVSNTVFAEVCAALGPIRGRGFVR